MKASEIATIPDQVKEISENFDLPAIPSGIEGTAFIQFKFTFELDQPNLRMDSVLLKNGMYKFMLKTNLDKDITGIDFEIPNMKHVHNGSTLQFTLDIDPYTGSDIEKDTVFNLSEYKIVFENSFADTNQVYINALVHFISDGEPPNNPYYILLENTFTDIDFKKYFGYVGQREIQMSDTIKLNIFDINQEGNFTFGDGSVNLHIDIHNSFGLPVLLDVSTFRAYHGINDEDSIDVTIFGSGIPSEIALNYPSMDQVGNAVQTIVNTDNSNMNEALGISPNRIFISIDGYLNPDANPSLSNFIIDTSKITVDLKIELRMFGAVNEFKVADTVDFDLGNVDEIETLMFATEIQNGFPINADVQLIFVDSVNQVLHTLFKDENRLMTAASVGGPPDFRVLSPSIRTSEISLSPEEVDRITEARKILINATLSTTGDDMVKIYSDYKMKIKMGAKVGIKL